MFFEDEKENLDNIENLDDLDLDLDEAIDDESISWDELLKDSSTNLDIVSVSPEKEAKAKAGSKVKPQEVKKHQQKPQKSEPNLAEIADTSEQDIEFIDDVQEAPKKDAFDVFGGDEKKEDLASADNIMDDENQSILKELDNMDSSADLDIENDNLPIGLKHEDKQTSIPVNAGILLAAVLVLGSIAFIFLGPKTSKVVNNIENNPLVQSIQESAKQQDEQAVPEEEQIPVVDDNAAKNIKADKKVVVSVESAGRTNPFLPTFDDFNNNYYAGIPPHSLLPPDKYGNEPDAQDLLRIAVSGILFDNVKPSAIITINGIDYFVQKGDMVGDYIVLDINRQFVVVKKGTNIYKAGVGERFAQNPQISGAAVYGSGGARQYKSNSDYTSASDVEIHAVEEN